MAQKIRIKIEEFTEDGKTYYLATSPDVQGFLAEAKTLEEMFEIAPQVMDMLLEERAKRLQAKEKAKNNVLKKFIYDLMYKETFVRNLQCMH